MSPYHDTRLLTGESRSTRWLHSALLAVLSAALAVTAFFFLVFALAAGALLALAIGIRVWWVMRKLAREAKATEALEGEYTVVDRANTGHRLER